MPREDPSVPPAAPAGPVSDEALVTALVGGDREALAALYDRHSPVLLAVATRLLGNRSQAEELLHDVFLEAWQHARDYDPSRGTVRAWLVTRMRSRALDRRAASARHARLAEEAMRAQPEGSGADAGSPVDAARLRNQVARLSPELVSVLHLAYFDGLSSAEIAEALSIPIGTVKSRMARALAELRDTLGIHEKP